MKLVNIVEQVWLANQFVQLTFEDPIFADAQPGHFVIAEKKIFCSLNFAERNRAGCIVSPKESAFFKGNKVELSPLQGTPLFPPDSTIFSILIGDIASLGKILFYSQKYRKIFNGLVIIQGNGNFPFLPTPSRTVIPQMPPHVIASIPLLEDWGITNRLTNLQERPGCYHGTAYDLAKQFVFQNTFLKNYKILSWSQAKTPPIKLYTSV